MNMAGPAVLDSWWARWRVEEEERWESRIGAISVTLQRSRRVCS